MTSTPGDPSDRSLIAGWALHAYDARAEPGVPTDTVQQHSTDTVQRPSASASARYAARAGRRDGIALVPSSDPAAARSQLFGQPPV